MWYKINVGMEQINKYIMSRPEEMATLVTMRTEGEDSITCEEYQSFLSLLRPLKTQQNKSNNYIL